jgi:hypothetical protein
MISIHQFRLIAYHFNLEGWDGYRLYKAGTGTTGKEWGASLTIIAFRMGITRLVCLCYWVFALPTFIRTAGSRRNEQDK